LEFVIVNLVKEIVEVYSDPQAGTFKKIVALKRGEAFASTTIPNLALNVEEILGNKRL
jgi:hypothetical protein